MRNRYYCQSRNSIKCPFRCPVKYPAELRHIFDVGIPQILRARDARKSEIYPDGHINWTNCEMGLPNVRLLMEHQLNKEDGTE